MPSTMWKADTSSMFGRPRPTVVLYASSMGKVHAVRAGQLKAVCGTNVAYRRYSRGYDGGWVRMPDGMSLTRLTCRSCIEGLDANTGPGREDVPIPPA